MVRVGAGAVLPVWTVGRAGAQAACVESVDDAVAVAAWCAGQNEAAVELAATG